MMFCEASVVRMYNPPVCFEVTCGKRLLLDLEVHSVASRTKSRGFQHKVSERSPTRFVRRRPAALSGL